MTIEHANSVMPQEVIPVVLPDDLSDKRPGDLSEGPDTIGPDDLNGSTRNEGGIPL